MNTNLRVHFISICVMCFTISILGSNFGRIERSRGQTECGTNHLRCSSGQCVAENTTCDAQVDCSDGSDKSNCSSISGFCKIPSSSSNEIYETVVGTNLKPGDYVPPFSVLQTKCKQFYKIHPAVKSSLSACINGSWVPNSPSCERACSPVLPNPTTNVKCIFEGLPLNNCEDAVEGTVATFQCEPLHELAGILNNPHRVCKDGTWSNLIPECQPVCGIKTVKQNQSPYLLHEPVVKVSEYPWHVGVYRSDDEYICGGSIINQNIVLSAAHCFTNSEGVRHSTNDFKIAGGKYYRNYTDPRDVNAQFSHINQIYIPERYKGVTNSYEADIAVVVLETPFKFTLLVQPVCFDRTNEFEYQQLTENSVGITVGWKFGNLSDELNEVYVPYRSYSDCYENVTPEYRKFLTYDKICSGYLYENKSVCQDDSDSGGGLVFKRNQNRYFIRGIVSMYPTSSSTGITTCDPQRYTTYTLISNYLSFVTDILNAS